MLRILFESIVFMILGGFLASGRTFTNNDGRTIEAELISATETEAVLKVKGKIHTYNIKITSLSESDQQYIAMRRQELAEQARLEAAEADKKATWKAMSRGARKVVEFVEENKDKKVGNGECWTLANEAFKSAGITRPGDNLRVWGGEVDWKNEEILPGDILELKSAVFSNGQRSAAEHTAVVMKKAHKDGKVFVYHQNWGKPGKKVSQLVFDLNGMTSGSAVIYRNGKR
jgi:hypothetical protein